MYGNAIEKMAEDTVFRTMAEAHREIITIRKSRRVWRIVSAASLALWAGAIIAICLSRIG